MDSAVGRVGRARLIGAFSSIENEDKENTLEDDNIGSRIKIMNCVTADHRTSQRNFNFKDADGQPIQSLFEMHDRAPDRIAKTYKKYLNAINNNCDLKSYSKSGQPRHSWKRGVLENVKTVSRQAR